MAYVQQVIYEINSNGRYEWIDKIGEGGFGFVGKVLSSDRQMFAIKVLQRNILSFQVDEKSFKDSKDRMQREIVHHKRLNGHPHIIAFKEVFLTPSFLCIVMEYAQGGDLLSYVIDCKNNRQPLTEDEARPWFQQLVVALKFSHDMNIVNRDIKLENTLRALIPPSEVEKMGMWGQMTKYAPVENEVFCLKLCDFGYSKDIVNNSLPNSKVGTVPYTSPEVLSARHNESYDGKKRDIWSLGVTLYCLFCAAFPFPYDPRITPRDYYNHIMNAAYRYPENVKISKEAKELVAKMLQRNPEERCSLDDIINDPWFQQGLPQNWNTDYVNLVQENQINFQIDEEITTLVDQVFDRESQH